MHETTKNGKPHFEFTMLEAVATNGETAFPVPVVGITDEDEEWWEGSISWMSMIHFRTPIRKALNPTPERAVERLMFIYAHTQMQMMNDFLDRTGGVPFK